MKYGFISKLGIFLATVIILATPGTAQTACNVVYTISPQNSSAFGAAITIQNTGTTALSSWTLTWSFPNGQTVSSLWNGVETQSGANVTVKNQSYNGSIAAGGNLTGIGFNGTWNGSANAVPTNFAINGTACGGTVVQNPSFTLSSSASALTVALGASGTDTVTVGEAGGFTGSVSFATSTLPSGVTASFSPTASTTSSVVTFAVASTTTAGSYPITITGTSGSLTATTSVTLTVPAASGFTLSPSATALSVAAGSTGTDTITVKDTGTFTGSVSFATSTLPTGVTASFSPTSSASASVVTFTVASSTTAGSYPITITGTSGSLTETATIALTVTTGTVGTGACNVIYTISPQNSTAFGAAITIDNTSSTALSNWTLTWSFANGQTISSLWNGVETQSGANVTVKNQSYNGSIAAGGSLTGIGFNGTWSGTNAVPTNFAINGTLCGGTVVQNPSFTLSPSASTLTVAQGASGTDTVTVGEAGGFTGSVSFAASGMPTGVTASFSPNPSATSSVVTFAVASTTAAGSYPITITGTSGSLTPATTTITLTVPAAGGFALSASATALSIAPGASGTDTIKVTDISPFTGSVTFSASGLPSGVTFNPTSSTTSTVATVAVASSTAPGTYPITITGTSGTLVANTSITLSVPAAGGFTLAPSATAISVTAGASGTDTITIADVSPFAGSVTFAASGMPTGVTASFSPSSSTTSSVATFAVASSTVPGAYPITITGASGTLSATTSITLTVTSSGFTLSSNCGSGSPVPVTQGGSGTCTITATGATGNGSISASGLPSGVTVSTTNPTATTFVITLSASSTATVGTDTITISVTFGGVTKTIVITMTISAAVTANATVTVNQSGSGIAVSDMILGMNLASWYDVVDNDTGILSGFDAAGIKAVRWPGGSWSDLYHWSTNTNCLSTTDGSPAANDTFANFVSDIVKPGALDVSLTADYGTNAACNGGGDPTEAAAWAAEAVSLGANVSHITVGNEEYGSWEEDMHAAEHDATTYANAVATGYYPDIKAASPNVLVGVVVNPGNSPAWDPTVLANAKYDFVEYHYYPEAPGSENDTTLIQQDAQALTSNINTIKSELASAGHSGTPIYVGEIGAPYSNPGKQSWSITQGLYAGQVLGEMMNDGVTRLTWWIGYGNCNGQAGNDASSLYGWQNFGAYNVFSDGPNDPTCPTGSTAPNWGPIGTMSPTGRAFQLFSQVAVNGETVLTPTVTGDATDVVAYAATHSGGTALVLFNRNETTSEPVAIKLSAQTTATSVTVTTYDKAIYDQTDASTPVWAGPTTTTITSPTLPLTLTLAPWSMNVVIIQ